MDRLKCNTCIFFNAKDAEIVDFGDDRSSTLFEASCRRLSPQIGRSGDEPVWPKVSSDDWCGQHELHDGENFKPLDRRIELHKMKHNGK
jgi:hypothetical protein